MTFACRLALLGLLLLACASDSTSPADATDVDDADEPSDTDATELPDAGPVCTGDTRTTLARILNGTEAPTWVPLTDSQVRRLVRLDFGGPGCTGLLVGDDAALAAAHCVDDREPSEVLVEIRVDGAALSASTTQAIELHPDLDVALLTLTTPLGAGLDPLALNTDPLDGWVGRRVESTGFGVTGPDGGAGRRRFVVEPIAAVFDDELAVDGENQRGLCAGDSGGAVMALAADGSVRVLGLLSGGSNSCVEADRFVRVDRLADWLAQRLDLPSPLPAPCGPLTPEGRCDRDRALYCGPDDHAAVETCEEPDTCRFDSAASAFRCGPAEPDPCLGLDRFGACEGDAARWCDAGVVRSRDCGSCDRVCGVVDGLTGVDCIPEVCDGLGIDGECAGDLARWCFRGELVAMDCALAGVACVEGRCECDDFSRQPTCVDDASVRCNGLFLEIEDCTGAGRVCDTSSGLCRQP